MSNINEDEYLTFCSCLKDSISNPEIIALVKAEDDKEYYDKIVKAWRANRETGEIEIIKSKKVLCARMKVTV